MCIAIVKPRNCPVSDAVIRTCFLNNPDGAGFAFADAALPHLTLRKGFEDVDSFLAAYHTHDVNTRAALIHFRIITRGTGEAINHHPFAIDAGALIHNGTISALGEYGAGKSDTHLFADMLAGLPFEQLVSMKPILELALGTWNKVAIMSHTGETLVCNESGWVERDGVLYSNYGFEHDVYGMHSYHGFGRDVYSSGSHSDFVCARDDDFFWDDLDGRLTLYVGTKNGTVLRDRIVEGRALHMYAEFYKALPNLDSVQDCVLLDDITHNILYPENNHV